MRPPAPPIVASGIDRSFETWPGGLIYLGTQRTNVSLSAGDNTVTLHERGQESVRANRDGTFTFSSTGRFFGQGSIGRAVVDLDTHWSPVGIGAGLHEP